jgi:hypothetical protein
VTNYSLSGTSAGSSTAAGILDISFETSNEPPATWDGVASYTGDPTLPTTGTVTSGVADGLPNNAQIPLTPFLRTVISSTPRTLGSSETAQVTIPSGILKGDVLVAAVVCPTTSTLPTIQASILPAPGSWTMRASLVDSAHSINTSIWTYVSTGNDAGTVWYFGASVTNFVQIRVYGNAVYKSTYITENALGGGGESTGVTLSDAPVGGLAAYFWPGDYSSFPSFRATFPAQLTNTAVGNSGLRGGCASAEIATVASAQPVRTAVLTPLITGVTLGKMFQVVVELDPLRVVRYAHVQVEEAVGASRNTVELETYLHVMGADEHSPQTAYGFTQAGMNDSSSSYPGTTTFPGDTFPEDLYSYERWVRVRFDPNFNTVRAFRFWAPNMTDVPIGWTVKYGTTSTYATPVNTASSIATSPVPTSDPGQASPNAGGAVRLAGTGTQYSDWIVLQASADVAVVGPGPVLGFSLEGTLIPIEFRFAWTET